MRIKDLYDPLTPDQTEVSTIISTIVTMFGFKAVMRGIYDHLRSNAMGHQAFTRDAIRERVMGQSVQIERMWERMSPDPQPQSVSNGVVQILIDSIRSVMERRNAPLPPTTPNPYMPPTLANDVPLEPGPGTVRVDGPIQPPSFGDFMGPRTFTGTIQPAGRYYAARTNINPEPVVIRDDDDA